MKITKEIKTAVLVIASILLFIWGYTFLRGSDLLTTYRTFYVKYDNVEGLTSSAPVTINGLVVGKVISIILEPNTAKLIVELQIKNDFPISKTSMVNIYEPGLIGGKQVQIIPDLTNPVMAESGETLQGRIVPGLTSLVGEKLTPLQEKIERVMVSADSLLNNINMILDPATRQNLRSSFENLDKTMAEFSNVSRNANDILVTNKGKIEGTMTNLNKASKNFAVLSDSLSQIEFGKMVRSLENSLAKVNSMMTDLDSGNGTLGKLMKDEALYNNLEQTSRELDLLLQDLRLNPTRYINVSLFGKKNKPYVVPKSDPADTTATPNN